METNLPYLILAGVCLFVGAVGLVGLGIAIGCALRTLTEYGERIAQLEALTKLKPNERAAMEKQDAYESVLWALAKINDELTVTKARSENIFNLAAAISKGKK